MTRPAIARIDLNALRCNYRLAKHIHAGKALAVIKANAYGHGAVACAKALSQEADGFAVAFLEEAITLMIAGITSPILILEGVFDAGELALISEYNLWMVVHCAEQIRMIERHPIGGKPFNVWLKVDSGMHRAGFSPLRVKQVHERLLATGKVEKITLMTHFARADEPDVNTTEDQIRCFESSTMDLSGERSLCNSAGLLAWPQSRKDWSRPGIMLYGADPLPEGEHGLIPVMTLESRIIGVKTLSPGDDLGYGARFTAERATRVGLVAMGYADGYPRTVDNGTPVCVDGKRTSIIGRVSMDMLTVDISHLPDAGFGSHVELWGANIPINQVASAANTISYELLCNVKRVPLKYADNQ